MKVPSSNQNDVATPYDDFPYISYPFPYTTPQYLNTIGKLFGMNPPPLDKARILELGGSDGGNMLNFAETYPDSYNLGIDLSKVEVEKGQKNIKELGFKNVELKHLSILDVDESYGKFDYIICHGVFSWVPTEVRDKILEISKKMLTPNGIAFISYNTLPGWNMVNTIRDMMIFHSSIFSDTKSKIEQAKLFLNFINEALEGSNTPYARFLKEETALLAQHEDQYIMHEYLAEKNQQYYVHQFMALAKAYQLAYVGDSNVHTMFIGNLPQKAMEQLSTITDINRTEQYIDFFYNRRFRCTLLCHDNVSLNRNITPDNIKQFYTTCSLVPHKNLQEIDLTNSLETINFGINNQEPSISSSSPIIKAIFYTYIENTGNPLKPEEVIKLAHKKLDKFSLKDFENEFYALANRLVFSGYLQIFSAKPRSIYNISERPSVSKLNLYQAKNITSNKMWLTTQINSLMVIQIYERYVVELLDGQHTIEQIEEKILERLKANDIVASANSNVITDETTLREIASTCTIETLERLRVNYLLIG